MDQNPRQPWHWAEANHLLTSLTTRGSRDIESNARPPYPLPATVLRRSVSWSPGAAVVTDSSKPYINNCHFQKGTLCARTMQNILFWSTPLKTLWDGHWWPHFPDEVQRGSIIFSRLCSTDLAGSQSYRGTGWRSWGWPPALTLNNTQVVIPVLEAHF